MPRTKKDYADDEMLPAPNVEWIEQGLREAGSGMLSIADLSERVVAGGNRDVLGRTLNRERRLKTVELVKMARELNWPFRVLLGALGYDVEPHWVKVVGRIKSDASVYFYETPRDEEIIGPDETRLGLEAVKVAAYKSGPFAPWSEYRFFFARMHSADAERVLAVVHLSDDPTGEALLGSYKPVGRTGGIVTGFATGEQLPVGRPYAISPILWIQCAG